MKTGVVISGKHYYYDLNRARSLASLVKGTDIIYHRARANNICKARVVSIKDGSVMVCDPTEKPYSLFWKVTPRDIKWGVYIINY